MAIEVLSKEDLKNFKIELLNDLKQLLEQKVAVDKKWLRSYQVRELLGVSRGKLQTMRENGTLRAAKIGNLLYFSADDINNLLTFKKKMI